MTLREERIGLQRLFLADCRAIVADLPRFDAILTDPPYELTKGGSGSGSMRGVFDPRTYDNSGELFPIVPWAEQAALFAAAAARDCEVIVMANDRNLADAEMAFRAAGFGFHRTLVWDKGTVTPNRWFMQGLEFALYLWRGRARPINDCATHPLFRVPQRDETDHPTEKPVAMFRRWVELVTAPNGTVLDPFMGSGTTLVACEQAGRCGTGIEINPQHFDAACRRVEAAATRAQKGLFDTPAAFLQGVAAE